MDKESYIAIGLMSGTSVDSIDAAAVKVEITDSSTDVHLIKGISYPIPGCIRDCIFQLFDDGPGALHRLALLNMRLGQLFAKAAQELLMETALNPDRVMVIASHGQTVHHVSLPEKCCGQKVRGSIQIGEPSVIAQTTGIPVVSDFRAGDIAAGGNGAPLAPLLDLILFSGHGKDIAAQNIGGIGNVTWIPKGNKEPLAFDTGPGNMVIDLLVIRYTKGRKHFDRDGKIGRQGKILKGLLDEWMKHPFLALKPPKSTGREEFGTIFLSSLLGDLEPDPDLIRTAEEFTALSIAHAYKNFLPSLPEMVIVTGGGAHNPLIMESLSSHLKETEVLSGNEVGIDIDFKEAVAFAVLGLFRILGKTGNVPEATGACRKAVLGNITHP
ncbi:MAG TPA: anhydro-N-acetylmuramic acid kinase [Spirochaetales bacterium]|nr:anhydro-N-acetylmuramic acid kinase [Spirochaetales bacterium]